MDPAQEWLDRIGALQVGRSGGRPAVHKPLLILMLLARAQRGEPRVVPYSEIRKALADLIRQFGTPGKRPDPKLPFLHLQSDGLWHVNEEGELRRGGPPANRPAAPPATGEVPEHLWTALSDPAVVTEVARKLLARFWPTERHEDVAAACRLSLT